jgi:hypothetical protein
MEYAMEHGNGLHKEAMEWQWIMCNGKYIILG